MRSLIFSAFRYEWRRMAGHRGFWFWSLFGVPFLLPALLGLVAVLIAVAHVGPPKPVPTDPAARAIPLLDQWAPPLQSALEAQGVETRRVDAPADLDRAPLALLARRDGDGSQHLVVRVAPDRARSPARLLEQSEAAVEAYQRQRVATLLDPLPLSEAERAAIERRPTVALQWPSRASDRRLVVLVAIFWSSLILLPYLQLARAGSSSVVNDRLGGLLIGVSSGLLSPRGWAVSRWMVLAALGVVLVAYYALLLFGWMWAYSHLADRLVEAGLIERLSTHQATQARFALIELVAAWRSLSWIQWGPLLGLALVQSVTIAALLLLGSSLASSVASSRIFELIPFSLVFFLPFLVLGTVGRDFAMPSAFATGLNSVLAMAAVLREGPATLALPLVLLANLGWTVLALESASRRASQESFLAPAGA